MENKMKEVAQLVGLELEEEFRLDNYSTKYKLTKHGFMYWSDDYQQWNYTCGIEELFLGKSQIVKIPKQILEEKEKEYLSAVIKPFRHNVVNITKVAFSDEKEYILIELEYCEFISMPFFKVGSMYKGMQSDKEYTLDELEL